MRLNLKVLVCAVVVTVSAWLVAGPGSTGEPPATETRIAKPAPQFKLKDTKGKDVKLSDFDGKALIVFFWTTWDKPSQKQLPDLIELQHRYERKGFSVIGISLDSQGVDAARAFAETNHVNFPVLMADADVVRGFGGLEALPTMFVLEPRHNVISSHVGVTQKSVLESELEAIFNQAPIK